MLRIIIFCLLVTPVWAVKTIARVGSDFITDYDVDQMTALIAWVNTSQSSTELQKQAKQHVIQSSQIRQLAARSGISIESAEADQILEQFLSYRKVSMQDAESQLGKQQLTIAELSALLTTEVLEKRLVFAMYKDRLLPTQTEIESALQAHRLQTKVNIDVLTAPLGTTFTEANWQQQNGAVKLSSFDQTAINHLPDAYQAIVLKLKEGDYSSTFRAYDQVNKIHVKSYQVTGVTEESVKQAHIEAKMRDLMLEWHDERRALYPVSIL